MPVPLILLVQLVCVMLHISLMEPVDVLNVLLTVLYVLPLPIVLPVKPVIFLQLMLLLVMHVLLTVLYVPPPLVLLVMQVGIFLKEPVSSVLLTVMLVLLVPLVVLVPQDIELILLLPPPHVVNVLPTVSLVQPMVNVMKTNVTLDSIEKLVLIQLLSSVKLPLLVKPINLLLTTFVPIVVITVLLVQVLLFVPYVPTVMDQVLLITLVHLVSLPLLVKPDVFLI